MTEQLPADEIRLPAIPESILATAPDHIWLDLGEEMHLIDHETKFRDLGGVTWSEDNATGCGIEYVRADRATAASAVADTLERFSLWRRDGDEAAAQPQPKEIGEAIDAAVSMLRDRAAVDAEGWQPIKSAPKDGRKLILYYLNGNSKPRTVFARWLTDEEAEETDEDDVGLECGWYECIDNWDDFAQVAIHAGEPTHWRRIPAAPGPASPTPAATELELLQVECAGHESAAFHLGMLVDELRPLLSRAMAAMKTLHEAAQPDESGPDIDAIVPGADFRKFVDAHAQLLHDVAQLPEAPTPTPAAAPVVQPPASQRDELLQASLDFIGTLTGLKPPPIEVAPPEVFAPFYAFVERVQGITGRAPAVDAPHVGDVGGARDREADRQRYSDAEFNEWLDDIVADGGCTVWHLIEDVGSAKAAWDHLHSTLSFKTAEIEADAARYRWLRDKANAVREDAPQVVITDWMGVPVTTMSWAYPQGADLDTAIDEARAAQQGAEK